MQIKIFVPGRFEKRKGLCVRYVYDNDLHIHSKISLCSGDEEQTNERILEYAKRNNLKTICLTDHFWDENTAGASDWYALQNFEHISKAKPLPQAEGIKFLFGCETEMDKDMTIGISKERFDDFDFVVIPTTHFHMTDFTIPQDCVSPKQKADFWLKKLNVLLDMDLPFHKIGLAHMTCELMDKSRENFLEIIKELKCDDLKAVFKKAAEKGIGIELNSDDMNFKDEEADIVLKPYKLAKEMGCKFYCGSDAHHPNGLDAAKDIFERAIDLLELTEDDKFIIR